MTDVRLDSNEVRRQLQRRRRSTGESFQQLLERYALDRFLFRLGSNGHRSTLVLKGAVLFSAWLDIPHRATRDVDFALLRLPAESDLMLVRDIVSDICVVDVPEDGVAFNSDSISVEEIREGASYSGARATLQAVIGTARVRADDGSLAECVSDVQRFAVPVLRAASVDDAPSLGTWESGHGWRAS